MNSFPEPRDTPSRPFIHCGIDYAGPISARMSKSRESKTTKTYICVFSCFAARAIHLELVSDYITAAFIAAWRRFAGHRGLPKVIYNDHRTPFKVRTENNAWRFLANPSASEHLCSWRNWMEVYSSQRPSFRQTMGGVRNVKSITSNAASPNSSSRSRNWQLCYIRLRRASICAHCRHWMLTQLISFDSTTFSDRKFLVIAPWILGSIHQWELSNLMATYAIETRTFWRVRTT